MDSVRRTVEAVRAGRSLTPAQWPNGARVAVALSFDVDNETVNLRFGEPTVGELSQGQYGARVALPRIVAGWIHEMNTSLPADVERELVQRAIDTLTAITGMRPVGYRAPSWNFSPNTLTIVRELGFLYESSLMADDGP